MSKQCVSSGRLGHEERVFDDPLLVPSVDKLATPTSGGVNTVQTRRVNFARQPGLSDGSDIYRYD